MTAIQDRALAGLAELFDAEVVPLVRRMAFRPPHQPDGDGENPAVRAMVWQALAGLGIPDLPRSGDTGQETLAGIAERLGAVLYQGPLLDTLTATELLTRADAADLLPAGASVAVAARGGGVPAAPGGLTVDADTLTARRDFVGFAADVDCLLVVGRADAGVRAALVARDHPTVSLRRREEFGRGEMYRVVFDRTPVLGWVDGGGHRTGEDWEAVLATARIRQAGYLVGLAQGALDLAVDYAKRRQQFGQPIGRFQWIAFRLSAAAARIDAARLLVQDAARLADARRDAGPGSAGRQRPARHAEVRLAAAQCLATASEVARSVATDAMQVHGAVGLTSENDVQLYYRRVGVESLWLGSPIELRAETLPLLRARVIAESPSTRNNPFSQS